jgi:DNA-binding NarL/FixJ family response regulator
VNGAPLPRPVIRARRPADPHASPQSARPTPTRQHVPAATTGGLTRTQTVLVRLLAEGMTDAQIAREMGWSLRSVSQEVARIRVRLGAANRAHAAAIAVRSGIIS